MFTAEMRDDVQAAEHLVSLIRLGCEVRLYDFPQPVRKEFGEFRDIGGDRAAACLLPELVQGLAGGVMGDALAVLAVRGAVRAGAPDVAPVAVLTG